MSSEQKPETWGLGLTWLVIFGIVGLIAFGAVNLRSSAIKHSTRLKEEKVIAEKLAKDAAAEESEKVKKLQLLEDLGPEPTEEDIAAGKTLYNTCLACHGQEGKGNAAMILAFGAPNIAGFPVWFAKEQILKIKKGYRNSQKAALMKPMVMNTTDEQAFQLAAYLSSLEASKPIHNMTGGDPVRGKKLYESCAACHGNNAEGNPSRDIRAAPLNKLPDWYIVNQIKEFKAGTRGFHPEDKGGATMKAQAMLIKEDQDVVDIVAYIKTLSEEEKSE